VIQRNVQTAFTQESFHVRVCDFRAKTTEENPQATARQFLELLAGQWFTRRCWRAVPIPFAFFVNARMAAVVHESHKLSLKSRAVLRQQKQKAQRSASKTAKPAYECGLHRRL
jgi:hypothetical protein